MRKFSFILLYLGLACCACLADSKGQTKAADPAQTGEKPVETSKPLNDAGAAPKPEVRDASGAAAPRIVGGAPVDPNTYVIGPEDVLMIRVWREAELSGLVVVRPDGKISLQLVNELQAAGLTPEQLRVSVADALSKLMTRPEVDVSVQTVNSKKYFLNGEVQKPGSYSLVLPTKVLEALVNAGGFREFANTKKIVVMRGSKQFHFNYKEVIKGKHLEQNILLESGDQIIVP